MNELTETPELPLPITVELIGRDGNAFYILGAVEKAIQRNYGSELADAFIAEATSGDYNHLLQTAMKWVDVT